MGTKISELFSIFHSDSTRSVLYSCNVKEIGKYFRRDFVDNIDRNFTHHVHYHVPIIAIGAQNNFEQWFWEAL